MFKIAVWTVLLLNTSLVIAASDKSIHDWSSCKNIHTIVVLPVVICTGALSQPAHEESTRDYQKNLRLLLQRFDTAFANRLQENPQFKLTLMNKVMSAKQKSEFRNVVGYKQLSGKQSSDWPSPDLSTAMNLAKLLKADAVLISALREPASIGEGLQLNHQTWNINPFNIGLRHIKPHVVSPRVQAILISRAGNIVWRDEELANHPRTKPSTARNLHADWLDSTDEVASLLADSLEQKAPPKQ